MAKRILAVLLAFILLFSLTAIPAFATIDFSSDGDGNVTIKVGDQVVGNDMRVTQITVASKFKATILALVSFGVMVSALSLAIQITKLIINNSNENARASALKGIAYSLLAVALLGGLDVVVAIFLNVGG